MAEKLSVLHTYDPWPISSIADEDLQALVDGGLLCPHFHGAHPDWLALGDEQEPARGLCGQLHPLPREGVQGPTTRFMQVLPHYYGEEFHNFNPNSITQVAIFTAICEAYLGIEPHWDLWFNIFPAEPFSLPSEVRKVRHTVRAGSLTLQQRSDRAQLYIHATHTSSNKGQSCWFYLRNDGGRLPECTQWVMTATGSIGYGAHRGNTKLFFYPFAWVVGVSRLPDPGPRGCGWMDGAPVGLRGADEEEGRGEEAGHEKRVAHNTLEKCRRAQERDGVPLGPSPSTDDDDNEGMEVRLGFSPEVRLWSEPTSVGPSSGADVPMPRFGVSVPLLEAQVSAEPGPAP